MKKVLISMMFLLTGVLVCQADEPQKFSPEKFQAEMEQFIAKEAGLTADESAEFFPLFREMQQKQRAVFGKVRQEGRFSQCSPPQRSSMCFEPRSVSIVAPSATGVRASVRMGRMLPVGSNQI